MGRKAQVYQYVLLYGLRDRESGINMEVYPQIFSTRKEADRHRAYLMRKDPVYSFVAKLVTGSHRVHRAY